MTPRFHPDLKAAAHLPRRVVRPSTVPLLNAFHRLGMSLVPSRGRRELVDDQLSAWVYGGGGSLRRPALLWLHGGGYLIGHPRQDEAFLTRIADALDLVVVSVDYRLATRHPFPAPLEDAHTALRWLAARPDVDPTRIAIGGASAGGGLAAGLALLARHRAEVVPAFQLLVYPMLDDRSSERAELDDARLRLWDRACNRLGWGRYLGGAAAETLPPWAVPGRCDDLSRLPPAWIGVGDLDLFHAEDTAYAERLRAAGVPCALDVVPGAYHGFDAAEARAPVARAFRERQVAALADALGAS